MTSKIEKCNCKSALKLCLFLTILLIKQVLPCPRLCICDYYAAIHTIDCSSQDFVTLPLDIPEWTTSFTFDGNELTTLNFSTINTTVYFEEFQIRYNMIDRILLTSKERLQNFPSLRGACSHVTRIFPRLKKVNLRGNRLKKLPKCLLFAWPILEILNLDENLFTSLRSLHFTDHLAYKDSLKELSMRRNGIKSIRKQDLFLPVSAFRKLRLLDLSENEITKIDSKSFFFLNELLELRLEDNLISTLHDFTFITKGSKLQEIKLAQNQILKIHKNAFAGLPRLQTLDLTHNSITCIQPQDFSTCSAHTTQQNSRHRNLLTRHPMQFQTGLQVNIQGNKWRCNCMLKPLLINQEHSNTIKPRIHYQKCKLPQSQSNNFVARVLNTLNCD